MGIMQLLNQSVEATSTLGNQPLCQDPCADHMLRSGGYCKLLSEFQQWDQDAVAAAVAKLQADMAFVPAGSVHIQNVIADGQASDGSGFDASVEPFFIDRYAVTNAQYRRFVDAEAYREPSYWPLEIQPYVFRFVDTTEKPGPATWVDGNYDPNLRDHPVVGISWHEANAYSNWIGKRLPTSPQWQHSCSWWDPNARYTWGSSFEHNRANTYSAMRGGTASVKDYESAATPNGIVQLIGNVWEWVDAYLSEVELDGHMAEMEQPLGEVRGGAYDTYLNSQATSRFRSGRDILSRSKNVGFRCVVSASLLAAVPTEN